MNCHVTDRDDPAIAVLVADEALVEPFEPAGAELVIIGEEEGIPVGLVTGATLDGQMILNQIGIRPGFLGQRRTRVLADAFVAEAAARGHDYVLIAVKLDASWAPGILLVLDRWPAYRYFQDGLLAWFVRWVPVEARVGR